jgi:hypothetical protein
MANIIVGKLVRKFREGLKDSPSLRVFSKRAGINYVTLSKIENGKSGASQKMIEKISKALGRKAGDITIVPDPSSKERAFVRPLSMGERIRLLRDEKRLDPGEFLFKLREVGLERSSDWLVGIENDMEPVKGYELDTIAKLFGSPYILDSTYTAGAGLVEGMEGKELIGAWLDPKLAEKLRTIAKTEHRDISGQMEVILEDWFRTKEENAFPPGELTGDEWVHRSPPHMMTHDPMKPPAPNRAEFAKPIVPKHKNQKP